MKIHPVRALVALLVGLATATAQQPLPGSPVADHLLSFCLDPASGNGFDGGSTNFPNCAHVTWDRTYDSLYENEKQNLTVVASTGLNCSSVAWDIFYCDRCNTGFAINPATEDVYALDR